MYAKINVTGTVALAVVALLFLVLTSCDKHAHNEDAPLNAHVAQVEAEKQLRDARVLVAR